MNYNKFFILFFCSLIALQSCSKDDDNYVESHYTKDVDIETFKGLTKIDVTGRNNWNLTVGGIKYQYNYVNDFILAMPISEIYTIPKNDIFMTGIIKNDKSLKVRLEHPDYNNSQTPVFPPVPNIKDQSTSAKLLNADLLYCDYLGKATNNIIDSIRHANALIDFNILEHPTGAKFYVTGPIFITPYNAYNRYKAITLATGDNYNAFVCMSYNSKQYFVEINNSNAKEYIKSDTHYRFSVRYDQYKDELQIVDLSKTKWSDNNDWR